MAKSLVTLGAAAALGTATLTTSNPATAQPWLAPVIVGSFLTHGRDCYAAITNPATSTRPELTSR